MSTSYRPTDKQTYSYRALRSVWRIATAGRFPLARFLIHERLFGFDVPSMPYFESDLATEWFASKLQQSRKYLEYGSGGSTYLAARHRVPFISIESDGFFLNAVRAKIAGDQLLNEAEQTYHHAEIGLTGPLGKPVIVGKPSARRLEAFRKYSDPPAVCLSGTFVPDLILVDGRFRVACALKILKVLANERHWTLVVDDYVNRPRYHVIANYARLERCVGRMAVFTGVRVFQPDDLDALIRHYETIPD
jgi:hypothetical protein